VTARFSLVNNNPGRHLRHCEAHILTFGPDGLVTRVPWMWSTLTSTPPPGEARTFDQSACRTSSTGPTNVGSRSSNGCCDPKGEARALGLLGLQGGGRDMRRQAGAMGARSTPIMGGH
jgi:hypothetical protein